MSSWWWKGSGVIVVVSGGGSGVIIVVIVARSGTTSRISAYFADIIWMLFPQRIKPLKAGQRYRIVSIPKLYSQRILPHYGVWMMPQGFIPNG